MLKDLTYRVRQFYGSQRTKKMKNLEAKKIAEYFQDVFLLGMLEKVNMFDDCSDSIGDYVISNYPEEIITADKTEELDFSEIQENEIEEVEEEEDVNPIDIILKKLYVKLVKFRLNVYKNYSNNRYIVEVGNDFGELYGEFEFPFSKFHSHKISNIKVIKDSELELIFSELNYPVSYYPELEDYDEDSDVVIFSKSQQIDLVEDLELFAGYNPRLDDSFSQEHEGKSIRVGIYSDVYFPLTRNLGEKIKLIPVGNKTGLVKKDWFAQFKLLGLDLTNYIQVENGYVISHYNPHKYITHTFEGKISQDYNLQPVEYGELKYKIFPYPKPVNIDGSRNKPIKSWNKTYETVDCNHNIYGIRDEKYVGYIPEPFQYVPYKLWECFKTKIVNPLICKIWNSGQWYHSALSEYSKFNIHGVKMLLPNISQCTTLDDVNVLLGKIVKEVDKYNLKHPENKKILPYKRGGYSVGKRIPNTIINSYKAMDFPKVHKLLEQEYNGKHFRFVEDMGDLSKSLYIPDKTVRLGTISYNVNHDNHYHKPCEFKYELWLDREWKRICSSNWQVSNGIVLVSHKSQVSLSQGKESLNNYKDLKLRPMQYKLLQEKYPEELQRLINQKWEELVGK